MVKFRFPAPGLPISSNMKPRMYLLVMVMLLLSGRLTVAQNYFVNTYGIDANPCLTVVSSDMGFFCAMSSGSATVNVMKTDAAGTIAWQHQLDFSPAFCTLECIERAFDGNFLVLLTVVPSGITTPYITVVKLDAAGNLIWKKSYHQNNQDVCQTIIRNSDNGFMLTGGGCSANNIVIKCDASGNIVWQKAYTTEAGDALAIGSHDYTHFVVSGYVGTDLQFFGIDLSGNVLWHNVISMPGVQLGINRLRPAGDGGYVAAGQADPVDSGWVHNAVMAKITATGSLSWLKIITAGVQTTADDIAETSDSSVVIAGFCNTDASRGMMLGLGKNGEFLFAKGEINQQYYSEYDAVSLYSPGKLLVSGQCQNGFLPTFIGITDNTFSTFCGVTDLPVTDYTPSLNISTLSDPVTDLSFGYDTVPMTISALQLTRSTLCTATQVVEAVTAETLSATPNPVVSQTSIRGKQPFQKATLTLYNRAGQSLLRVENIYGHEYILHRGSLPAGSYLAVMKQPGMEPQTVELIVTGK
jgi:hypothetical protein